MPSNASPRAPATWWHAQRSPPAISQPVSRLPSRHSMKTRTTRSPSGSSWPHWLHRAGRHRRSRCTSGCDCASLMSSAPPRPSSPTPRTSPLLKGLPVPGILVASPQSGRRARTGHTGLPGRDEELEALDGAFLRAQAGTPVAVVIEGEPGIGKTAVAVRVDRSSRHRDRRARGALRPAEPIAAAPAHPAHDPQPPAPGRDRHGPRAARQ